MSNSNQSLQEKYTSILKAETKTAWKITDQVVEKPEISVWMILIPIVFIPFIQRYQRYKTISKEFIDGYLFTKKIALATAHRIHSESIPFEQALSEAESRIHEDPNADSRVREIYAKQKQEVVHLITHYAGLLGAGGSRYEELIQAHYKTKEKYLAFIDILLGAEQGVSQAASCTFRREEDTEELPEIIIQVQEASKEIRRREAERIFDK